MVKNVQLFALPTMNATFSKVLPAVLVLVDLPDQLVHKVSLVLKVKLVQQDLPEQLVVPDLKVLLVLVYREHVENQVHPVFQASLAVKVKMAKEENGVTLAQKDLLDETEFKVHLVYPA